MEYCIRGLDIAPFFVYPFLITRGTNLHLLTGFLLDVTTTYLISLLHDIFGPEFLHPHRGINSQIRLLSAIYCHSQYSLPEYLPLGINILFSSLYLAKQNPWLRA